MKNYDMILIEQLQKYQHYQVKLLGKIDKYQHLTVEERLPSDQSGIIQQANCTYSPP